MDAPAQRKSKLIDGWEVVIGMEVHAQVTSQAKLFSGASTAFGGEPNSHVSLVDAAMPGMLPVINAECVRQAVRTGLGLKAKINLKSVFDRKNYFYPDLPQGYQISQYKSPIVGEGEVIIDTEDGETAQGRNRADSSRARCRQVLARPPFRDVAGRPQSFRRSADGNRFKAGSAFLRRCKAFMVKLRIDFALPRDLRRRYGERAPARRRECLGAPPGEALGTRCEIKNLNSISFIGQAIEF